jgi:hypothetical protein
MAKRPDLKRCAYCDARIDGEHALDAMLHDPWCPHGKALAKLAEATALLKEVTDGDEWMGRLPLADPDNWYARAGELVLPVRAVSGPGTVPTVTIEKNRAPR